MARLSSGEPTSRRHAADCDSLDHFDQLHHDDRQQRTRCDHSPVRDRRRDSMQNLLQERQVDRCDLEDQTNSRRRPEPAVRKQRLVNADRLCERALKAWKT